VTPVTNASFPNIRMRRLRQTDWVRRMVRETKLSPDDLVWSIIVHDGEEARIPVAAMPGVDRLNVAEAAKVAKQARSLGIPAIAMFPHVSPAKKDPTGNEGLNPDNIVCRAVKAMKDAAPEVGLICDVALDPFTDHGHDGLIEDGRILNDPTVESLIQQALIQARAGCDVIAPSDMMDGRIGAVRQALEADGLQDTMILSYAAKYASAFYGPYREAIGSAAALKGDKKTYQMDYGNSDEALREVALDLAEGADMVMVKPGLPYLDIIRRIHDEFAVPTFAFQVSGEYAMMKAAAANGWLDENRAILETLGAFKRAGCAGIITYAAPQAAKLMDA
jgi:porphobilinogen synthase